MRIAQEERNRDTRNPSQEMTSFALVRCGRVQFYVQPFSMQIMHVTTNHVYRLDTLYMILLLVLSVIRHANCCFC